MASQVILPKLTYEMEEGRILEWLCTEGQPVAKGQNLFVVETDKAAMEVPAEVEGTLLKILAPAGTTVAVSKPVAWIGAAGEAVVEIQGAEAPATPVRPAAAEVSAEPPAAPAKPSDDGVLASPLAKRLARELGVDLRALQRTMGAEKRIRESDVQAFAAAQIRVAAPSPAPASHITPEPTARVQQASPAAEFELLQLSPVQRSMAAHLAQAVTIPTFAASCEVDLSNLERFRENLLPQWEKVYGFRLTYTHILAALVARALEACPMLNTSWSAEGIRRHRDVNLCVAMASERGLVVPVVKRANQLSLLQVATEVARLRKGAESKRLAAQDLQDGTFTLTNVGMLGITLSIPVINPPQSGILAVGARRQQLALQDGLIKPVPVATITLVADHRVVDGAMSAEFLRRVKEWMENPWPLLLEKPAGGA